jgi:hypothetical protein
MAVIGWEKTGHFWSMSVTTEELAEWSNSSNKLYAVLDACDEPLVLQIVAELGSSAASLYHGRAALDYSSFAPYLACVDEATLRTIRTRLAATPWGFFVGTTSDKTLADVRRHFRQYLLVQSPEGKQLYFRFYDPRFLATFLRSLEEKELQRFLGPLRFIMILGDSSELTVFTASPSPPSLHLFQSSTAFHPQV